ncbi:TorD/DmsD family molecular chaperone [Serratia microhaemolytica]|uniref:TorD/DmsD family molecular chaperone n=1 Tax=Serratia microhaemolytica TaxID=2675110 RepID=UPI000FDDE647|nr:molecular chaperone [Serratia microhaemolytica]
MNEFSVVCRVLGSLFYRHPQDPLLAPLFELINSGQIVQHWPLEQDQLLGKLKQQDMPALANDFNALFIGSECRVPPVRSEYDQQESEALLRDFLQQQGMPLAEGPSDHFGALLLAASWLEDHQTASDTAQITLFDQFLLPWCDRFLGKVEAHANTAFYRTLAIITRDAIAAMYAELTEPSADGE